MTRILLVDDEETLRVSLSFTLRKEGYEVTSAADGPAALQAAREQSPDVILLDLMLPGLDGMEVCRRLRATTDAAILMLTARGEVEDRVAGLRTGADDYVTKPFSTAELIARIEAVLRRRTARPSRPAPVPAFAGARGGSPAAGSPPPAPPPIPLMRCGVLEGGPVRMDLDRHEVRVNGTVTDLSPKEFQLLRALLSHRGRALSREDLIQTVWGDDFMGDAKTLDVHIRWLRGKVEPDPGSPRHINTVRGVGFRFD